MAEYQEALSLKTTGNDYYKEKQLELSEIQFKKALDVYGTRRGGYGEQCELKSKILSNLSAIYLQRKDYTKSLQAASEGLILDPSFIKLRIRRIQSLLALSNVTEANQDIETLMNKYIHKDDVNNLKLMESFQKQAKKLRDEKWESLAKQFGRENMMNASKLHPTDWCVGLTNKTCYEWFIDCYRMRIHDGVTYDGIIFGNNYAIKSAAFRTRHFLFFIKLAYFRHIIPNEVDSFKKEPKQLPWSWPILLLLAAKLLKQPPFEKANAIAKYGRENYFDGSNNQKKADVEKFGFGSNNVSFHQSALMKDQRKEFTSGQRSLRYTAEQVYKVDVYGKPSNNSEYEENVNMFKKVRKETETCDDKSNKMDGLSFVFKNESFYADIGGMAIWKQLYDTLDKN